MSSYRELWQLPYGPLTAEASDDVCNADCDLHEEWEKECDELIKGEAPTECLCSECQLLYKRGEAPQPDVLYLTPLVHVFSPSLRQTVLDHVPDRFVKQVLRELLKHPHDRSLLPSYTALMEAHDAWLHGCPLLCLRNECVARALHVGTGASAVRRAALRQYGEALANQEIILAQRSALLQIVATLPSPGARDEGAGAGAGEGPLPPKRQRIAADSADVVAPLASSAAADDNACVGITAASLPGLLEVVASRIVPRLLIEETLSALACASQDAAPLSDPSRSFRSFFAAPWHPTLRTFSMVRLHEMYAAAGYLGLPLSDCEPLVRDAAQRLVNASAVHGGGREARWDARIALSEGFPPSLLLSAAQRCFRAAVEDLATPRFAALLRRALDPTSTAAIKRLQSLLVGWGSPGLARDFCSLELEECSFLATARGLEGGKTSLLASVLFGHKPTAFFGLLDRTTRKVAWELLVDWACVTPAGKDLEARAARQWAREYAPYETARRRPAAPSQLRMVLEVVEEGLGLDGEIALTPALLDLVACHTPAIFERFRRLHITQHVRAPSFDVLHLSPGLEAAFRDGDEGVVEWAIRTGTLPDAADIWSELSSCANTWLADRKLKPLQLLVAAGLPVGAYEIEGVFRLPLNGADWVLMQAAESSADLLQWALDNVAPATPPTARGPAALFGSLATKGSACLSVAIAAGCATTSVEQSVALILRALEYNEFESLQLLRRSGFDLHSVSPVRLFDAFLEGRVDERNTMGEEFADAEVLAAASKLRDMGVFGSPAIFVDCLMSMPCEDLVAVQRLHRMMWPPGKAAPPAWLDGTAMTSVLSSVGFSSGSIDVLEWCANAGCSLSSSADVCCASFEQEFDELEGCEYDEDLVANNEDALARWRARASQVGGSALLSAAFEGAYHPRAAAARRWLVERPGGCPCRGDLHERQHAVDAEWEEAERVLLAG